jgi:hypothetical protein
MLRELQVILSQERSNWAGEWRKILREIETRLRRAKMMVEFSHQQPFQDLLTTWDVRKIPSKLQEQENPESQEWNPVGYYRREKPFRR